jgi:hypothetical protein
LPLADAPSLQQQAREGEEVVDGRDQSGIAGGKGRARRKGTRCGLVIDREAICCRPVLQWQAVELLARNEETGILHSGRVEDTFLQEGGEALSRGSRDQHAEHVRARGIEPLLAGLGHQWQGAEAAYPLVGFDWG